MATNMQAALLALFPRLADVRHPAPFGRGLFDPGSLPPLWEPPRFGPAPPAPSSPRITVSPPGVMNDLENPLQQGWRAWDAMAPLFRSPDAELPWVPGEVIAPREWQWWPTHQRLWDAFKDVPQEFEI